MWTVVVHGLFLIWVYRGSAMEYRGNTYSVKELNQEFSSPGDGDPANYAPWAENHHVYPGGHYMGTERYMTYTANDYPSHYLPFHMIRYNRPPVEDSDVYQEPIPSIHSYKPSFMGKDYNEYPHILPPGGKSIEQLQQEADFRIKKIYFESHKNSKIVGEKIMKLKDTYGYGTIGYPGYKNTIKYEPIDLGTHNAVDLGSTLDGPGLRLPVQMVTVTKTLGVRVPQPYPVRHEVPVPAPFPVPVTESHFHEDSVHSVREVKQYLNAFANEFSGKPTYSKPESVIGKSFSHSSPKLENESATAASTTPPTVRSYSSFRPPLGVFPSARPHTVYHL